MAHTPSGTQQDGVRLYQATKMMQFWNFLQLVSSSQPQWELRAGLTQGWLYCHAPSPEGARAIGTTHSTSLAPQSGSPVALRLLVCIVRYCVRPSDMASGDSTQVLKLTRQALYQLSHLPIPHLAHWNYSFSPSEDQLAGEYFSCKRGFSQQMDSVLMVRKVNLEPR